MWQKPSKNTVCYWLPGFATNGLSPRIWETQDILDHAIYSDRAIHEDFFLDIPFGLFTDEATFQIFISLINFKNSHKIKENGQYSLHFLKILFDNLFNTYLFLVKIYGLGFIE